MLNILNLIFLSEKNLLFKKEGGRILSLIENMSPKIYFFCPLPF